MHGQGITPALWRWRDDHRLSNPEHLELFRQRGDEESLMLVLIHKECGGAALEESPVGETCAIPADRFPFSCFSCLEEIVGESEVRLSEELGI